MAGINRSSFSESSIVAARGGYSTQPADKLHADSLLNLFDLAQQDAANLPRSAHMGPAAGGQVKLLDVDDTQVAGLFWRQLAQAELTRLLERNKTYLHRTVFRDHLVGQPFGLLRLRGCEPVGLQVN